jgi:OPT oligopeptide transporter protein
MVCAYTQGIAIDDFDDPNFDPTAAALEDESPYPEVRSAVSNTDDPSMPASTFRAWTVGLIWAILIPGVNQFFFFRYPSITITQVGISFSFFCNPPLLNRFLREKIVPQVLSFPICKAWARYLPNISLFGIPLNPGPFTIKEHVIITIMAGVGATSAYAVSVTPC